MQKKRLFKKRIQKPQKLGTVFRHRIKNLLQITTYLAVSPLLILAGCLSIAKTQKAKIEFPNIIQELEDAPPFGDPKLYKEWRKSHR